MKGEKENSENLMGLRRQVLSFSNSYFELYHSIVLEQNAFRLDQISNFYINALFSIKNLYASNGEATSFQIDQIQSKLRSFLNEMVLLQYHTRLNKAKLKKLVLDTNCLIEFLENMRQEKSHSV